MVGFIVQDFSELGFRIRRFQDMFDTKNIACPRCTGSGFRVEGEFPRYKVLRVIHKASAVAL